MFGNIYMLLFSQQSLQNDQYPSLIISIDTVILVLWIFNANAYESKITSSKKNILLS